VSALLEIEDLRVDFSRDGRVISHALRGVSLAVGAGEAVGVVGETGCGKTLTGLSVLRMLPDNARASGRISFDGRDLLGLSPRELRSIRGGRISMIFQSPGTSFNPVFTVGHQIGLVAKKHLGIGKKETDSLVSETLHAVGLPNPESVMRFYPHELSGGMLQRAMIAMAIICRPSLLIADEPTTALDVTIAQQILRLLRRLQREQGFGVFFISHDLDLVSDFCDRVAVLYAGRVVETGGAEELLRRPRHPYTRALLEALPGRAEPGAPLPTVPGTVPTELDNAPGCAFAPRCPLVIDVCRQERPALLEVGSGRTAACHRSDAL
jgi:peptide/nickel transport system ATP-binding protein